MFRIIADYCGLGKCLIVALAAKVFRRCNYFYINKAYELETIAFVQILILSKQYSFYFGGGLIAILRKIKLTEHFFPTGVHN